MKLTILGDVLIYAACVAYLGQFVMDHRQEVVVEWHRMCQEKDIPVSAKFNLTDTLGEPVKIRDWQIGGLPVDRCVEK